MKVFSREIIDNFKNAKVFSREKNSFFQANFKANSLKLLVIKNQTHHRFTVEEFELLCGGKIQTYGEDGETEDETDSEWEAEEK